jgi:hypothetical protein
MKISDIEFQGDGSKATFYYTIANDRDFRQLIKILTVNLALSQNETSWFPSQLQDLEVVLVENYVVQLG